MRPAERGAALRSNGAVGEAAAGRLFRGSNSPVLGWGDCAKTDRVTAALLTRRVARKKRAVRGQRWPARAKKRVVRMVRGRETERRRAGAHVGGSDGVMPWALRCSEG
jgi:hypothetical protein